MPLTADQQAMLQLLLERGQSYADLASLLGISEPEVRSRARQALTELGGEDPDRNVGLTDYLLGQADPIGRADAARHLRDDPDDRRLAAALAERLGEIAPGAKLPGLPGESPARRRAPTASAPGRSSTLSSGQTRLFVGLGSAAVLLIGVVLGVTGAFGGDDEPDNPTTTATSDGGAQTDENFAKVPLRPVGGGDAQGEATIGLASADTPYLDLTIRNLEPAPSDRVYILWLLLQGDQGYPLTPVEVSQNGRFDDRFVIPSAFVTLLPRVQTIDVALADNRKVAQALDQALQSGEPADQFLITESGNPVLSGQVAQAAQG